MAADRGAESVDSAHERAQGGFGFYPFTLHSSPFTQKMLIEFFLKLKQGGLPVSIKEFLTLLEALDKRVISGSIDDFYYLSRACLIKDESNYDKFDRVFGAYFKGITELPEGVAVLIPEEWLKKLAEKHLTEEEKKLIESLGGWDKLMETLKKRLEEQKGRHQGGNKWIGTAG